MRKGLTMRSDRKKQIRFLFEISSVLLLYWRKNKKGRIRSLIVSIKEPDIISFIALWSRKGVWIWIGCEMRKISPRRRIKIRFIDRYIKISNKFITNANSSCKIVKKSVWVKKYKLMILKPKEYFSNRFFSFIHYFFFECQCNSDAQAKVAEISMFATPL